MKKELLSVFFLLAFAACLAGFASASIGIGLSDPKYEAQMVESRTYYFSFTAHNTGDGAGTYSVNALIDGKEISGIFDVNYSIREFTLEPNATKLFWISLTPVQSSGNVEAIVELSRKPDSVSEGASTIGLHARSSIKASLVLQGPASSFETIPAWYSGNFPAPEAPILNPAAVKALEARNSGASANEIVPGVEVLLESRSSENFGSTESANALEEFGNQGFENFAPVESEFEVSKKFTVLKTIDSSLAESFSTKVDVSIKNNSAGKVSGIAAFEKVPKNFEGIVSGIGGNVLAEGTGESIFFKAASIGELDAGESAEYSFEINAMLEEADFAGVKTVLLQPVEGNPAGGNPATEASKGVKEAGSIGAFLPLIVIIIVALILAFGLFLARRAPNLQKKSAPAKTGEKRNPAPSMQKKAR